MKTKNLRNKPTNDLNYKIHTYNISAYEYNYIHTHVSIYLNINVFIMKF